MVEMKSVSIGERGYSGSRRVWSTSSSHGSTKHGKGENCLILRKGDFKVLVQNNHKREILTS